MGPSLQACLAHLDQQRTGAALMADLGDQPLLLRQVGQHPGLMPGDAHRLLDIEVLPLLQAPEPDVVHDVRLADGVYPVRGARLDHRPVVGIAVRDAIGVGRRVQTRRDPDRRWRRSRHRRTRPATDSERRWPSPRRRSSQCELSPWRFAVRAYALLSIPAIVQPGVSFYKTFAVRPLLYDGKNHPVHGQVLPDTSCYLHPNAGFMG